MDNKSEIYAEWSKLVNMTKSELQKFYDSEEGKQAGLSKKEADEKGIHSGRESARWILKMKSTPKSKWSEAMWGWAKRQISFIKRMSGVDGSLRDEKGNPTRKLLALKIWGNDPEKFKNGGFIPKEKHIYLGKGGGYNVAEKGSFELANELESKGVDSETIRKQTGWFRNKFDKLWRYEIDDRDSKINIHEIVKSIKKILSTKEEFSVPLKDVYVNDELFKAYGESIKELPFVFFYNEKDKGLGNLVVLPLVNKVFIKFNVYEFLQGNVRKVESTITERAKLFISFTTHELQHAVQVREGLSSGSSVAGEYRKLVEREQIRGNNVAIGNARKNILLENARLNYLNHLGEIESLDSDARKFYDKKLRIQIPPYSLINFNDEEVIVVPETKIKFKNGGIMEKDIIVYHGSTQKFDKFNIVNSTNRGIELGSHFGTKEQALDVINDKASGEAYLYKCRLNLKNTLKVDDLGWWTPDNIFKFILANKKYNLGFDSSSAEISTPETVLDMIKSKGIDSFVYSNLHEGDGKSYLVFDSNAIEVLEVEEIKEKTMNDFTGVQSDLFDESKIELKTKSLFGSDNVDTYAKGGQLDYALLNTDDWDDVPVDLKNTSKVKEVKWEADPKNEGLNKIVKPFLSTDNFRPVMMGFNFDDKGITVTDAHKLLHIPVKTEYSGIFPPLKHKGLELNSEGKIDGVFVNYKAVINYQSPISYKVDLYKLIQYSQVALNFSNKATNRAGFKVNDEMNIGLNCKFLIVVCKALLELGYESVYAHFSEPNRAMLLSPDDKLTDDSVIALLMPVMLSDSQTDNSQLGTVDLDYGKRLSCYFDFEKNEIINGDGSVVDFKMNYGENKIFTPELVKTLKKTLGKNKSLYILESFSVEDKNLKVTDLENSMVVYGVDVPNGLYEVESNSVVQSTNTNETYEDYPKVASIENTDVKFKIYANYFIWVIESLLPFLGNDDLRPTMSAMNISKKGNVIKCAGTNAHILKSIEITDKVGLVVNNDFSINVNAKKIIDGLKYLNTNDEFDVESGNNQVKISTSNGYVVSRLEDGRYPNYEAVIPQYVPSSFKFETKELVNILNSSDSKKFIKKHSKKAVDIRALKTEEGLSIYLFTTNSEYGNNVKVDEIDFVGKINYEESEPKESFNTSALIMPVFVAEKSDDVLFDFNYSLFLDFIGSLQGDVVQMNYTDTRKAYLVNDSNIFYTEPKIKPKNKAVKKQVEKGLKVEQEHRGTLEEVAKGDITVDEAIAKTVDDHLKEDENYYDKLEKVEGKESISDLIEALELLGEKDLVDALKMLDEDKELLAPNGKKSNLNKNQYELVRTPAFKKWFGDWENEPENASKVVDENGEPLVVYHGTPNGGFNVFSDEYKGKRTEHESEDVGFHFTNDDDYAKTYSLEYKKNHYESLMEVLGYIPEHMKVPEKAMTYNVFLNIKKPKTIPNAKINKNTIEEAKLNNEDGIFAYIGDKTKEFVVFNPNQIKLADGTNTTFDENTNDIRFDKGGEIESSILNNGYVSIKDVKGKEFCLITYNSGGQKNLNVNDTINSIEAVNVLKNMDGLCKNSCLELIDYHIHNCNRIETKEELEYYKSLPRTIILDRDRVEYSNFDKFAKGGLLKGGSAKINFKPITIPL